MTNRITHFVDATPTAAIPDDLLSIVDSLRTRIAIGNAASAALAAITRAYPVAGVINTPTMVYGNGEPDSELAAAAGLHLNRGRRARTDKWRKYLALRRQGMTTWRAIAKTRLHQDTARKLDALV